MAPKRPPALERLRVVPDESPVSITDTMTLRVRDSTGEIIRVRSDGITDRTPHSASDGTGASPSSGGGAAAASSSASASASMTLTTPATAYDVGSSGVGARVSGGSSDAGRGEVRADGQAAASSASALVGGKLSFDDLRVGHVIGRGSQGSVRVAKHRVTGQKFALKQITLDLFASGAGGGSGGGGGSGDDDHAPPPFLAELLQVNEVAHRNVVTSYEAFFRNGTLYIALEYMNAGTMNDVMRRHRGTFSEDMLAYIARELLSGLQFLHSRSMMHRDIKPANVLANRRGEVKISDFGVARRFSGGQSHTITALGSTPYMSPERIAGQSYSFSSDIWSAGLTIAECALGEYPFSQLKLRSFELYEAVVRGQASIDWSRQHRRFSDAFVDFIAQCLSPAAQRPSASQLLTHPFLQRAAHVQAADAGAWFCSHDTDETIADADGTHHHAVVAVSNSNNNNNDNGSAVEGNDDDDDDGGGEKKARM